MGASVGQSKGVKSEINVTPLVDVVLVLLIIFMVITPMLQRGKDVQLPAAGKQVDGTKADPIIVSLLSNRQVFWESTKIDESEVSRRIEKALSGGNRRFLVKADARLAVGDVRRLMHVMQGAGAKSIALAVQEEDR